MATLDDSDGAVVRKNRTVAADRAAEHGSCEDQVKLRKAFAVVPKLRHLRCNHLRERRKDLLNLLLLRDGQLAKLIVQFYHLHRLDEGCGSRCRLIVNHAGHLVFVLALIRQAISSVALRYQRILKHSLGRRLRQQGRHTLVNLLVCNFYLAAHTPKSRAGIIRNLLLREDAAVNLPAQLRQRLQKLKPFRQRILRSFLRSCAGGTVLLHPLGGRKDRPDTQQLRCREAPAVLKPHKALANIADSPEGKASLPVNPLGCVLGFALP